MTCNEGLRGTAGAKRCCEDSFEAIEPMIRWWMAFSLLSQRNWIFIISCNMTKNWDYNHNFLWTIFFIRLDQRLNTCSHSLAISSNICGLCLRGDLSMASKCGKHSPNGYKWWQLFLRSLLRFEYRIHRSVCCFVGPKCDQWFDEWTNGLKISHLFQMTVIWS